MIVTNIYFCEKCKRELGDDKKLCFDCQNKKDDKEKTIFKWIFGGFSSLVGVALIKHFFGSDKDNL
ncbi:TPA: hypothetical protein ACGOW3_001593 [Streptococcus suis]